MSKFAWSCSVSVSVAALSAACTLVACGGDDVDLVIGEGDASLDSGPPGSADAGDAAADAGPSQDATTSDATTGDDAGEATVALDAADAAGGDAGLDASDGGGDAGLDAAPDASLCAVTCGANASCANTSVGAVDAGTYACTCAAGYAGDGVTCTDIDECSTNNGGCSANATCTNTVGSFSCACNTGYVGTGLVCDATLDILVDTNLSTTSTGTRTCADGGDMVAYSVAVLATANAATTATLAAAPSAGCLSAGDSMLLLNMEGGNSNIVNVGSYEFLTVASVTGSSVVFTTAKTKFYGDAAGGDDGLGTTAGTQRVVLQRVPAYASLTVEPAAHLTANAWNGITGGVFAATAIGDVTINGALTMSGLGYAGAPITTAANANGTEGESYDGLGTMNPASNYGGGGGGQGNACATFGVGGGGGGYGVSGSPGAYNFMNCAGSGGKLYGSATLSTLFLGSGGGSGGEDDSVSDNPPGGYGGKGGGIVYLSTTGKVTLGIAGTLSADGAVGQGDGPVYFCNSTTTCWDYAGPGGGGAGGSVFIAAATFTGTATAAGGAGGLSEDGTGPAGNGGAGSPGIILHP